VSQAEREIERCNRCGYCQAACPAYAVTRSELSAPRAHVMQMRLLADGEAEPSAEMLQALGECMLCRACADECPAQVVTPEVVVAAREAALRHRGQPRLLDYVFRNLLHDPRKLAAYARPAFAAQRVGLGGAARALKRLPGVPPGLAAAPDFLPQPPRRFLRDRLAGIPLVGAGGGQLIYFAGCAINLTLPEVGEATLRVLARLGWEIAAPENACCGLPPYAYGDVEAARRLARRNLDLLDPLPGDFIVTDCASCSSFLKEYPQLLADDETYRERAERAAARVRDLTEVLADADLPQTTPLRGAVTYHDPCHLSRYQGIRAQPRAVLQSLEGLDFRELEEADRCCGGAGTYGLTHYEVSMKILERKIGCVERTGAQVLATACPSCQMQLGYGLRRAGSSVRIRHLVELVAEAMGLSEAAEPAR